MRKTNYNPSNRIVPIDYLPYLSRLKERYSVDKDQVAIDKARIEFGFSRTKSRKNVVKQACLIIDNVRHIPGLKKQTKQAFTKRENKLFFASDDWKQLRYIALKNAGGRCQCCGARPSEDIQLHVDHIKPRSRYPELALDINNLQVLCDTCNVGKSAWDDTDWRKA